MTSFSLLLWITSAIVLELSLYFGIGIWRKLVARKALAVTRTEMETPDSIHSSNNYNDKITTDWTGFRTFTVNRKEFEDLGKSICSFYLVPEDGQMLPFFQPGQFLTFRLEQPIKSRDSKQIIRCYSLSDAPHGDYYRVSIKRVPQPISSDGNLVSVSNYFHDYIDVGSHLQIRMPSGQFHIDQSNNPIVLIGGGVGVTPLLSMLNWSLANQPGREVWLFYGVANSRELIMKSALETLARTYSNFHLWICFNKPLPEDVFSRDYHYYGQLDIHLFRKHLPLKPYHFYICGPNQMMENLLPALEDSGVPESNIHYESFGPATMKHRNRNVFLDSSQKESIETEIAVNFAASGKALPWQSSTNNLLKFAETNGISVSSSCREGSCGTCQTTILSGEVTYLKAPDYEPDSGTCLICVCAPKTNLTLEL